MEEKMFNRKFMLAVALLVIGCGVFAAPWAARSIRRRPHTLIVVGNYSTPYLLAETIQGLTLQPYLLINNDGRCFIVMRKLIHEVAQDDLHNKIDDLNVRRLLIIGDENYVSKDMEMKLRKINIRNTPILRIYGENWDRIAAELDDLLNIGNLAKEFRSNRDDISLRVRRPAPVRRPKQEQKPEVRRELPAAEPEADAPAADKKDQKLPAPGAKPAVDPAA